MQLSPRRSLVGAEVAVPSLTSPPLKGTRWAETYGPMSKMLLSYSESLAQARYRARPQPPNSFSRHSLVPPGRLPVQLVSDNTLAHDPAHHALCTIIDPERQIRSLQLWRCPAG